MTRSTSVADQNSEAEIARRRDELAKHMLNTPPRPLKPQGKSKPKAGAGPKKLGRPEK